MCVGIVKNLMGPCTRNAFGEFWLALQKFVLVEVQVTVCLLCADSGFGRTLAAWAAFTACWHRRGFFTHSEYHLLWRCGSGIRIFVGLKCQNRTWRRAISCWKAARLL